LKSLEDRKKEEAHTLDKVWIRDPEVWTVGIINPGGTVIIAPRENLFRQLFMDVWLNSEDTYEEHLDKALKIFQDLEKEQRKLDYIR